MFYFKTEPSSGDHSQEGVALSKEEWEGRSQTILLARRTRTIKQCSSDARSEGQPRPLPLRAK